MNNDSNLDEAYDSNEENRHEAHVGFYAAQHTFTPTEGESFNDASREVIFAYEYLPAYA